jgi:hypothetical protein
MHINFGLQKSRAQKNSFYNSDKDYFIPCWTYIEHNIIANLYWGRNTTTIVRFDDA